MSKEQEALHYLKNRDEIIFDGYDYYTEIPYGKSLQYTNAIDTLQQAIDELEQTKKKLKGTEILLRETQKGIIIYQKAMDIIYEHLCNDVEPKLDNRKEDWSRFILDEAEDELENGK